MHASVIEGVHVRERCTQLGACVLSRRLFFIISPASRVVTLAGHSAASGKTVPIHTLSHLQTVYFNLKMNPSCAISAARKSQM
jgi:hypothetical protein